VRCDFEYLTFVEHHDFEFHRETYRREALSWYYLMKRRLVHIYWEVDSEEIYEILRDDITSGI
jgi:uncharacterized protein YutE (UPF0331/DUF86 family)